MLTTPHRKKLIMLRNFTRCLGHVARMGERRGAYRALVGKPEVRRPLERTRRRWEDNIKRTCEMLDGGAWTGSIWLRTGQVAGSCECGDEPADSIKCGEFLE